MNSNYISRYLKAVFSDFQSTTGKTFASIHYNGQRFPFSLLTEVPEKGTQQLSFQKDSLEFQVQMTFYPSFHAVEWQTTVTNHGDEPSGMVSDIATLDLKIPFPVDEKIFHKGINGDSCTAESFLPFFNSIESGKPIAIQPVGGKSSHHAFPFFDLCEDNGGLICAIGWSGTWHYEISREDHFVSLKAGLPDACFYMEPKETLRLPRILVMGYEGSNVDAHNCFRRLMKEHFSPKRRFGNDMKMPIALQNFDRYTYTVPSWNTEEGQIKEIDFAKKCEYPDTYWLDAAWFKGGFPTGVGNYIFREGFPNGLSKVSDYAHENGLRTMIWFEPERVDDNTQLAEDHPEFLLSRVADPALGPTLGGKLFDLSNPKAVDFLIDLISGYIERYHIDIYRHDFNIFPAPFWSQNDQPNRRGIMEIKYIDGFYRFWDTLLERFPNLLIDNCASGGNRMDLETYTRSVFCWRSDTGCFPATEEVKSSLWNQNQNLNLSNYIVYHAIACWDPTAYDVRSAITNGFAPNFDVFDESCDFEHIKNILAECSRLRKYWTEDFYPLSVGDLSEEHWSLCQFGNAENGVLLAFRREHDQCGTQKIALQGLSAEQDYLLKITDEQYQTTSIIVSGRVLSDGYYFTLKQPRTSITVEYIKQV